MTWKDVVARLDQLLSQEKQEEETPEWVEQTFAMAKLIAGRFREDEFNGPCDVDFDIVNCEIVFKWSGLTHTFQFLPAILTHRHLRVGNSYAKWMEIV